jgi:tetratricopeptide (TPR) repeat protein/SAM-dependent methyltransferase
MGKRSKTTPPTSRPRGAGLPRPDVGPIFALAVQNHQAGRFAEAERLYRDVVAIDPAHVTSLHHLGILALQSGRYAMAVEVVGKALACNDRLPECHYNMAFALRALGRLDEAIAHYQRATALKPDYPEAHTNLGNVLKDQGRLDEAAASYQRVIGLRPSGEAHCNLANVLSQQGRMDEAVPHYQRALALNPDLADAHANLGTALTATGKPDEARIHFRRALALNPNSAEAFMNIGNLFFREGDLGEAERHFQSALRVNPALADAHNNLGLLLAQRGNLAEAVEHYRRALKLKPAYWLVNYNLGLALLAQNELEDAAAQFQQVLVRQCNFSNAYVNLARIYLAHGDPAQALNAIQRALAIHESNEAKTLFAQCAKNLRSVPASDEFRELFLRALSEPWRRPAELARTAAVLIKQDRVTGDWIGRATQVWPQRLPARDLFAAPGLAAGWDDRLICCALRIGPVNDAELERFLTQLRFALLELASATGESSVVEDDVLNICCALAQQCYINEYVFDVADEESHKAQLLRNSLVHALQNGGQVPALLLTAIAAYFPLHSLPCAEDLLERPWPAVVRQLLTQQVREPKEEKDIAASIARLTTIEDDVSEKVRQQYEENPYPRWVKVAPAGKPTSIDEFLQDCLPASTFRTLGKKSDFDILVAGCGTGQHAIETAQLFHGSRVLAIDLSLASLGYAMRKTRELGLGNIEFAQADILQVGSIGRTFDLIEAAGVLHHLRDPFAGWRALLSLLRPGGFMVVALYSELGRTDIVAARSIIADRGYQPNAGDIRRLRSEVMNAGAVPPWTSIATYSDFFSTSSCRDLLLHVQEHRLTLPQVRAFLEENDLAFLGFEIDPAVLRRFGKRFSGEGAATDLDLWHVFESENPKTFAAMYQFWIQKKA